MYRATALPRSDSEDRPRMTRVGTPLHSSPQSDDPLSESQKWFYYRMGRLFLDAEGAKPVPNRSAVRERPRSSLLRAASGLADLSFLMPHFSGLANAAQLGPS